MKVKFGLQLGATGAPMLTLRGETIPLQIVLANKILNSDGSDKEKAYSRYDLAKKLGALQINQEVELTDAELTIIEEVLREGGFTVAQRVQIHQALQGIPSKTKK